MRIKNDVRSVTNGLRPRPSVPALALFPLRRAALALALTLGASGSWAGYAQLAPPPNWVANTIKVAANDVSFAGGVRSASAVVQVAGTAVTMPAAYRFAANAGSVAASAAFANPGIFAALAIGSTAYAAYQWFKDAGFEVQNNVWQKKTITTTCAAGTETYGTGQCVSYQKLCITGQRGPFSDVLQGCPSGTSAVIHIPASGTPYYTAKDPTGYPYSSNFYGQITSGIPATKYDPATEQQIKDGMSLINVPGNVPQVFPVPNVAWPVESPILNPSPAPSPSNPLTDPTPTPQPMRVPQGDPVPIPNTSPQQYKTPVIDIVPSPTADYPWRVDMQPKDIVTTSPSPLLVSPVTSTTSGTATPTATTSTQTDCDKYPDSIGCAKFGDQPQPDKLVKNDVPFTLATEVFSSSSGCPSDLTFSVIGRSYAVSYRPICDRLALLRTLFICMAGVMAAYILADSFKIQ